MKPLHVNLAARPWIDRRPAYAAIVIVSILVTVLAIANFDTWYRYRHETQSTRAKIAAVDAAAAQERQRAQVTRNQLDALDLGRLERQTYFVNRQLAERAFSWSEMLDDLESVIGEDVRLTSISPSIGEAGRVALALSFESRSPEGMIDTLNRFYEHAAFENPFPSRETNDGGIYTYQMTVTYKPKSLHVVAKPKAAEVRR